MSERGLGTVLRKRFSRVTSTVLASYALLVVVVLALVAEAVLRRSLEHTADVTQSLLGAYADSDRGPGSVLPAALVDQLLDMGGRVVITRTTNADGMIQVYFLSPGMPARRLEGIPASASPDDVRRILLATIAQRARWRYRALHRAAGAFDIYVVASREPYVVVLLGLMVAAALLLPVAALAATRGARAAVADALQPLERVTAATRAIGPAELGKRIDSPTGQAEVTELAESINRMLERVDRGHRAVESFTAAASHELRTPLTHLRAQVQWASAQHRTPSPVRESLAAMETELERTTKVVDELLLIARGESRRLALARAPFDLTAVVEDVQEITEAMAVGKGLDVGCTEWAPAPVAALGDANRTRQILLNLASNAVRYTASGCVTFFIREDGDRVGVSVQDTGSGIAAEHLPHVFDRFFRVEPSRNRALGGTGLGLAIARLLAELQGGDIAVESVLCHGSTFTLWLPRAALPD
ncbi:MAG TPA: HAMP domain-containing sensor histidine kinase [Gemmatimonadales bacterium]|nr:HAMP domain-containing sensor histidine kinase [Gemmatimonadales bacterium]